jgi:hypothetical protein
VQEAVVRRWEGDVGYQLQAVVAPAGLLRRVADGCLAMHVVDLAQGFALAPMTGELHDEVAAATGDMLGFFLLPGGFGDTLAAWSAEAAVAYVEADFFGGIGSQSAAVWGGGQLAFGPLHTAVGEPFPVEGSPIAQALRRMGVGRGRHRDEFDAVGLGRHRDHEGWLAEVGVTLPEAYS